MNADLKSGTPCVEQPSAVTPTGATLSARETWSDAGQFGRVRNLTENPGPVQSRSLSTAAPQGGRSGGPRSVRMLLSVCAAVGSTAPRRFGSTSIRLCANSFAGRRSSTDWRQRILCYRSTYSAAPVGLSSPSVALRRRHRITTPALASPPEAASFGPAPPGGPGRHPFPARLRLGMGVAPRHDYGQFRPLLTARTLACDPGSWRIGAGARDRGFR